MVRIYQVRKTLLAIVRFAVMFRLVFVFCFVFVFLSSRGWVKNK